MSHVPKTKKKINNLQLYYQNSRGLRTKTHVFYRNIVCNNYDVVILTETWLNSSVLSSELFDERYVVYRRDRESSSLHCGKEGGGVLIAVKKNLKSKHIQHWESNCEDLWVTLELPLSRSVRQLALCAVYLPPPIRRSSLEYFLNNCTAVLEHIKDINIYIVGDFNMSGIDWRLVGESNNDNALHSTYETLIDFTRVNRLTQFNTVVNAAGRILDLVLSTHPLCSVTESMNPLSNVDQQHPPLEISIAFNQRTKLPYNHTQLKSNFKNANYASIRKFLLELNWIEIFKGLEGVNEMLDSFYEMLQMAIQKFIPPRVPKTRKYPLWFSRNLIKLLNLKNRLRRRYCKYKNPLDAIELKVIGKRCDTLATTCYNAYINNIEEEILNNPKMFWTHVKTKRGGTSAYPVTMTDGINTASNGTEMCEMFAKYFSSVYTTDHNTGTKYEIPDYLISLENNSQSLTCPDINPEILFKLLKNLDSNKGAGPDEIPPIFIKECASALVYPLMLIFKKSLVTGVFPSKWKIAKVVPVHKSDTDDMVSHYRPISILSTCAKIFESLICPYIQNHLKLYLSDDQHGFVGARSTSTNLVPFTEVLIKAIDSGHQADVIYTDFSKAFDKICHKILIQKLRAYGITGTLLNWLS